MLLGRKSTRVAHTYRWGDMRRLSEGGICTRWNSSAWETFPATFSLSSTSVFMGLLYFFEHSEYFYNCFNDFVGQLPSPLGTVLLPEKGTPSLSQDTLSGQWAHLLVLTGPGHEGLYAVSGLHGLPPESILCGSAGPF